MLENPIVTMLMCHHNYEEWLGGAIRSAKSQIYPNTNICFIDDCSDDIDSVSQIIDKELFGGTPETHEEDGPITIRRRGDDVAIFIGDKSRGPSFARNIGIYNTINNTDYYAILDCDDENYSNKIEELMKVVEEYPGEVGVVYADCDILNTTTGLKTREYREPFDIYRLHQECIVHSGSLINKEALLKSRDAFGYYDETMRTCEDYDLWTRISEKFIIIHVPKALSLVRVQPRNSTDTVSQEIWNRNFKRVHEKRYVRQHDKRRI